MARKLKKEDLRIKKTYKALINSMQILLNLKNFNQITVNDLCKEAEISRASFYVHFNDKYDFLKYLLFDVGKMVKKKLYTYEGMKLLTNSFIEENETVMSNILFDANNETLELIHDFIASIILPFSQETINNASKTKNLALSTFCTGGIINVILWQLRSKFPFDDKMINLHLYEIIQNIIELYEN